MDQANLADLKIDNLPSILNFDDKKEPLLVETRERVVETAKTKGADKAEAVAATYEKLAEELLPEQLDESQRNTPQDHYQRLLLKARGGLLINMAKIWRDAGVPEKCLEALERAIQFARTNRWASVVTALENEKHKLLPSGS
ncbi:MAG TPA: hypothetical protein VG964_04235 [Candidatus Saccharimonadales bacterium]|nr:hypothetical protein [Candidatus Saccharimonadales bacterium]